MKLNLVLGAALVAPIVLAPMTSVQAAIECQAEIIKGRASYWSYRLIDGRKCWYEGEKQIPKSDLHWADKKEPSNAGPPAPYSGPVDPPATDGQASRAAAEPEMADPEDGSCCWPPAKEQDTFEARWHSFGLRPQN